jgi:hypothetical protein
MFASNLSSDGLGNAVNDSVELTLSLSDVGRQTSARKVKGVANGVGNGTGQTSGEELHSCARNQ